MSDVRGAGMLRHFHFGLILPSTYEVPTMYETSVHIQVHLMRITRKQTLKSFSLICKEGWARVGAPILLLIWH